MPEHNGLMRIFWPLDIRRTDVPGVIVGWRNSECDLFVVAILEHVEVYMNLAILAMETDFDLGTKRRQRVESWDSFPKC